MQQKPPDVATLRAFGTREVRVRLDDHTEFTGRLRTDRMTDESIAVYLQRRPEETSDGVTIYLDTIVDIAPL